MGRVVSDLLPRQKKRKDGKGHPHRDSREVMSGVVYILFSGAPWHLLPKEYPPYQTCHRYFQMWTKAGVFRKVLARLSAYHSSRNKKVQASFIDGSLATAKKGPVRLGKTKRGKGSKIMAITTKRSRPLALPVFSATPFEVTLVEQTIKERFSRARIGKLVGDRAYDSDPLDGKLKAKAVELIAPHKRNRRRKKTQDGRKRKVYKKRWTIECFFAWPQNFRRWLVRWERNLKNFQAFIYLAAIILLLRYF